MVKQPRAVASGAGGRGAAALPEPVEADRSSLQMCLFSLESVILIVVTRNCLLFSRAEKLVGPRCVQIVSKRKQNPLLKLACICTICKVHSNLQGVSVSASESID